MSKMINEFTLTHLQPVFAKPRNNAMIVLRIKLRCCMRLDLDHSPLYTFYNMNGLGWEPRQKVDCISSGYFYPVFAFISTRDIPILLGDENNILSLEQDLGMLTSPCPGDCCWTHNIYPVWCPLLSSAPCWQDAAVHCSQVSAGDKDQLGPVTLMTWCHDSVTKVRGCHVVMNQTDTCDVCSCHNTASSRYICQHQHWHDTTQDTPSLPNIYIRMCVHQIPVIVSRENVCLDNCLFIYTLPCVSC